MIEKAAKPVKVPDERSRVNMEERKLCLASICTKDELSILADRQTLELSLDLWQLLQDLVVLHPEENEVCSKCDGDDVIGHVIRHQPVRRSLSSVANLVCQENDRIFSNVLKSVDLPQTGGADGERWVAVKS